MKFSVQLGDDDSTWSSTDGNYIKFSFEVQCSGNNASDASWDASTNTLSFGGYSLTFDTNYQ